MRFLFLLLALLNVNCLSIEPNLKFTVTDNEEDIVLLDSLIKESKGLIEQMAFEQAQERLEKARKLASHYKSKQKLATIYHLQGNIYYYVGEYQRALNLYQEAAQIRNRLGLLQGLADSYNNIGNVYYEKGDYNDALSFYIKVKDVQNDLGLLQGLADSYNNIGLVHSAKGQYELALSSHKEAKAIRDSLNLKRYLADSYNNIGNTYYHQGQYENALNYHKKAITIRKSLGLLKKLAASYNNVGSIYHEQNKYKAACGFYDEAIAIQDSLGLLIDLADSYDNKGLLFYEQKKYEEALHIYEKVVAMQDSLGLLIGLAISYDNMGLIYCGQKKYKKALNCHKKAMILQDSLRLLIDLATSYNNIGAVYYEQSEYENALKYHRKAAFLQDSLGILTDLIVTYHHIGEIHYNQKHYDKALNFFKRSIQIVCQLVNQLPSEKNKQHWLNQIYKTFQLAIECAYQLNQPQVIFHLAQQLKAKTLNDLLTEREIKDMLPASILEERQLLHRQITAVHKQLNNAYEGNDTKLIEKLKDKRRDLLEEIAIHHTKVKTQRPEYAQLTYVNYTNGIDVSVVQHLLQPQEAIVEYIYGRDRLYALVLTHMEHKVIALDSIAMIKENIEKLRGSIKNIEDPRKKIQAERMFFRKSSNLYRTLIVPIQKYVTNKHLIIIPDGQLHNLPFEVLISDTIRKNIKDYNYLIKKYSISRYPSTTTLFYQRTKGKKTLFNNYKKSALLIGNPDTGKHRHFINANRGDTLGAFRSTLGNLPFAEDEVNAILTLFPNSDIYKKKAATETRFKSLNLEEYRYIHLACHGFLNPEDPMLSGLLLSAENKEDSLNDGILQTYEIFCFNLKADLVTLSACETGLGQLTAEGIMGLTRSWLYAGASSLVVSLWQVDDEATFKLMTRFYTYLCQNDKDKYEALRKAQLEMIASGKTPFHWAGFVFIGEMRNGK